MTKPGAGIGIIGNALRGEVRMPLGGKTRLLKFNLNSMASFSQRYGIAIEEMQKMSTRRMTLQQLRDIIYFALAEGCRGQDVEVDFTELDVGDWLQEVSEDKLKAIFKTYDGATSGEGKASARESKN